MSGHTHYSIPEKSTCVDAPEKVDHVKVDVVFEPVLTNGQDRNYFFKTSPAFKRTDIPKKIIRST